MNETESRAALSGLIGPLPATDTEALAAEQALLKPRLRELVRGVPARRRRKRMLRAGFAVSSLVLSAGLAVFVWQQRDTRRQPFTVESGTSTPLANAGQGFVTGRRETTAVRTPSGALVAVGTASRVEAITAQANQEQVILDRGSVSVRVPHLAPGGSFSVKTPDALVTVHGTVFTVRVTNTAEGAQTCVSVDEGVVWVERPQTRVVVRKGQSDNCIPIGTRELPAARDASVAAAPSAVTTAAPTGSKPAESRGATASAGSRSAKNSALNDATLAEQNRLLAAALQAERAGRPAEAKQQLQRLIERFPDSALRAEAENSLARVQKKVP